MRTCALILTLLTREIEREIHDLIHPEEDPLQYRKKKKDRVFAAAAVQHLKPILPLNDQGVRFMNQSRMSSPFLFGAAQLQQLKAQIVEHHQLLIQVFLLTKRLHGHEHVTDTAWDLLVRTRYTCAKYSSPH